MMSEVCQEADASMTYQRTHYAPGLTDINVLSAVRYAIDFLP